MSSTSSQQSATRRKLIKAIIAAAGSAALPSRANSVREWTVLAYINGKNNLEPDALDNFHAIAQVGSSDKVAIVVQLGRPKPLPNGQRHTTADGAWSGVYRFYVEKNTQPVPAEAKVNVDAIGDSTDMGSSACLSQFLKWGRSSYPAKRYMVIIWNHGQGWRFMRAADKALRTAGTRASASVAQAPLRPRDVPAIGGYRAVSSDDDTGSLLYNKQIQDVVEAEFKERPLELLGYDACLMSMAETAYAFAPTVSTMVASEELEPAAGWDYERWVGDLVRTPTMSPENLAASVVRAYEARNRDTYVTTLSSLRLRGFRESCKPLSVFAGMMKDGPAQERHALLAARQGLLAYGDGARPPMKTSVDLIALLTGFESQSKDAALKKASSDARSAMQRHIAYNYASSRSAKPSGSKGIAIYFPESRKAFEDDPFNDGYKKANTFYPVDFVKNEAWADMLYAVLQI